MYVAATFTMAAVRCINLAYVHVRLLSLATDLPVTFTAIGSQVL